jgi:hypothetical protein
LTLPHRRGSPAFAFELCSRSLYGSYSPKFLETSNFRLVSLNTRSVGSNWFRRPSLCNSPVESNGERLQARSRRYSNRAPSFECVQPAQSTNYRSITDRSAKVVMVLRTRCRTSRRARGANGWHNACAPRSLNCQIRNPRPMAL